jgi:hypothetical protein
VDSADEGNREDKTRVTDSNTESEIPVLGKIVNHRNLSNTLTKKIAKSRPMMMLRPVVIAAKS